MNILVINPTSESELNDTIFQAADQASKLSARSAEEYTHTSAISLDQAPRRVASPLEIMEASMALMEKVRSLKDVYDGFIIAHTAELGADALQELTGKPVVSSGAAAVYSAPLYGHRIAVLSRSLRDLETHRETLRHYGILHDNLTFLPVMEENAPLADLREAVSEAAEKAKKEHLATVLVLGDPSMGILADDVSRLTHLPVLEGITSALIRIEYMVYQQERLREHAAKRT